MLRELDGYRVLVYDNASGDDTVSLIKKDYPLVRLHSSEINRGYGRAANSAFRQSDTPYALLLNPDVEINRGQIDALIASIAKLDNDWLFVAPFTGEGPAAYKTDNNDPLPRISFATGCAMLINLQNHGALEGFDENIVLFFEETDLCKRAIDRQFKMYYAETIRFPHASGQSVAPSPQLNLLKRWHYHWSYLYFCKKHHQWARLLGTVLKNMLVYPVKLLYVDKESEKAKIYRARRSATMAFITGGNAFIDDDLPFIPAADE
jgi:GT2 family glycosyltransferase